MRDNAYFVTINKLLPRYFISDITNTINDKKLYVYGNRKGNMGGFPSSSNIAIPSSYFRLSIN